MSRFPEILELEELLYRIDAAMGAAEAHGVLCGMLCARGTVELSEWVDHVVGEQEQGSDLLHDVVHKLSELHQATLDMINDASGDFKLLLPDDDDSLPERVEAIAAWCQGFIYGLAAGGIQQESELPEDAEELLKDMVEISRAGQDVDDGGDEAANEDEDEVALMEIEEYVRMGVLLIYEELQPLQTTQTIH
ncbi:MAG: YecA family protein [Gammaproteobacteria bacterium]|nr:YecA family protein [Gammaproteobacteria bacterium]NNL06569.1 YecA family protein [Gammaproteobacteria bacterium]